MAHMHVKQNTENKSLFRIHKYPFKSLHSVLIFNNMGKLMTSIMNENKMEGMLAH